MSPNSRTSRRHSLLLPRRRSPPTVPETRSIRRPRPESYQQPAELAPNAAVETRTLSIVDRGVRLSPHKATPPFDIRLLDYVSDYDANLMCPICRTPFVDPVVLSECEHCFCRSCLRQSWNTSDYTPGIPKGKCPSCRTHCMLLGRGSVPRILVNILDDLLVKCPNHQEGCIKQVKRGDIQDHVNNYCGHSMVACPDEECELLTKRKDALQECRHVDVSCLACKRASTMAELERHWQEQCPARQLECDMCHISLSSRDLSAHKLRACTAVTVPCIGSVHGCTFRAKREAMARHESTCSIAAISPALKAQDSRLNDMEEQLTSTTRRLQILEGGFSAVEKLLRSGESTSCSNSSYSSRPSTGTSEVSQSDLANTARHTEHVQSATDALLSGMPAALSDAAAADSGDELTPYTHLLSLQEALREEVARVSAALQQLDSRHSMTMLSENMRLKEEIAYLGGQLGGLARQVGWLTSARLHQSGGSQAGVRAKLPSTHAAPGDVALSPSAPHQAAAETNLVRRLSNEGRVKL